MTAHPEHRVLRLDDIRDPGALEFFVGAGDWPFHGFVVRLDGAVRAYANVCPHRGHPLNLAADDFFVPGQRLLRCSSHNALFDAESGLCIGGPCVGKSLRALPCRVDGGDVLVLAPAARQDN